MVHELLGAEPPTLERFLSAWYGPPNLPGKALDGVWPGPVREWFEVTSRWSRPVSGQNRVMGDPPGVVEDGKLLVWMENQGVRVWGVDVGVEDPEVYDRMNMPGEVWQPTGLRLSVFLVQVAVFEAVWCADHGAGAAWVTSEQCQEILQPLSPIPRSEWRWPTAGSQLYAGKRLLALVGPNPDGDETADTAEMSSVFVAGRDHAAAQYLSQLDGIGWDSCCWSQHGSG